MVLHCEAQQLAFGDVSPFSADVDFAKLKARTTDDSGVLKSGPIDRIFADSLHDRWVRLLRSLTPEQ